MNKRKNKSVAPSKEIVTGCHVSHFRHSSIEALRALTRHRTPAVVGLAFQNPAKSLLALSQK